MKYFLFVFLVLITGCSSSNKTQYILFGQFPLVCDSDPNLHSCGVLLTNCEGPNNKTFTVTCANNVISLDK
jgi:hypothetical protein